MSDFTLLSIDPGRDKIGIAIVDSDKRLLNCKIISRDEFISTIKESLLLIDRVILGNGTHANFFLKELSEFIPELDVFVVDEKNSTLEARALYFKFNPPKGLKSLLPRGLLFPPVPVDDYAAAVIAYRYIDNNRKKHS